MPRQMQMREEEREELASQLKSWRKDAGLNSTKAAEAVLGVPWRTLDGIEQGRGFAYAKLLVLGIQAFRSTPDRQEDQENSET